MRKSGIELLRILAASAVVILHYHSISSGMGVEGTNKIVLELLVSFAICAVNVFVAISGFFMIKSQKRTWGKILSLLFQVSLINVGIYLISVIPGNTVFSWNQFIQNIIPHNYFVILYSVMYIFSPYVNFLILNFSPEGRKCFLIISIALFAIWPSLVNVSGDFLSVEWFGLSSIGAWGSQKGFTIVNFLLLYSIGACLRLETFSIKRRIWPILLCGVLIFVWALIGNFLGFEGYETAWDYHNPLVILMAILLLNYFNGLNIQSKIINNMAKAAFFCYLLHYYILIHLKVDYFITQPVYLMVAHILGSILIVYLISWAGFFVYNKLIGPLFNKLDKFEIDYKI